MDATIFSITEDDIQNEALNIVGRKLNNDEISLVIKQVQYGLGESMIIMYRNIYLMRFVKNNRLCLNNF